MKQTDNNQMDLLLRDLARREGAAAATSRALESASEREASASRTGDQSHSAHLDADELNCYAEGSLPELTRARYTSHLADCQRCRKLVTELTLAAGVNPASRAVERTAPSSLWKKLSAFFSPPVLRYAVPALALFAVIAVAVIGLRERQEPTFVAQNNERAATTATPGTGADTKVADEPATAAATPGVVAQATKQVESPRTPVAIEDKKKLAEKEEASKGEVAANVSSSTLAKDLPAPVSDASAQPFATEPPPPTAKEQVKTADARRADEVRQQEQEVEERDAVAARRREEQARPGGKADQNTSAPQSPDSTTAATRRAKPLGTGGRAAGVVGGATSVGSEDVRTVGGRRFRRQGQTWIDTAYDPSQSVISVVRGSEQYRALVADEPGIRTIADQLQGEVVLVWKNRTYRIR